MNGIIKPLNKYIFLLIVMALFGMPWFYIRFMFFKEFVSYNFLTSLPTYVDFLIQLTVIVLLIIDFKKYKLKNVLIACIAALFFSLLGVVIFGILLLEKRLGAAGIKDLVSNSGETQN
jgi:hypothetical protein